ncbi:MAG: lgt 1 [Mucilaginibacter sp.]|jgi:phosphatidylglycerol:prolipoprotein diacylglycerol transferase|nr:lgt 1 [Mucilaginibacter sp.]
MFPTLTDLIQYIFHVHLLIPIQTFGFFVALSFFITYFVFVAELKRKEADGQISAYTADEQVGAPASIPELIVNGLLGFLFGFKIVELVLHYKIFAADPGAFIFSVHGNLPGGLICGLIFMIWIYIDRKRDQLPKPVVKTKVVHPYQLMVYLAFVLGISGVIGSKLFSILENFQDFIYHPVDTLFSRNGFNYYGGLIFGSLAWLYICHKKGMKLIHLADIGSPGMMLAYGIGRIGCYLSGDGDWGIVSSAKPVWLTWLPDGIWSFKFPHNAIDAGELIPGCFGEHCRQLPRGVYPTSLYEAVLCVALFGIMWGIRKYIRTPGLMFYLFLILNGAERLLIETIRINQRYHFFGMVFTQAEIIGIILVAGGAAGVLFTVFKQRASIKYTLK